ncbi:MAG: MDR family MFS transporter [Microbacteriaceae bacterium]|nr:MDR family MFS transporter [Microbacteriaceae bacterium]
MSEKRAKTGRGRKQRASALLARNDNIALWVLLSSLFVVILNETLMNVALPVLMREMHVTAVTGQWLTSGFVLTMSVVIPITGTLIQRLTTRRLYFFAMFAFLTGTLICLVAPNFWVLLSGRVVQAVGTAIMMPLLTHTTITVVPKEVRGRIMGRTGTIVAIAPALGPTTSGIILQYWHWRMLFAVMVPIVLLAIFVAWRVLRNVGAVRVYRIDALSVLLSVLGFGGLVYGLASFGHGDVGVHAAEAMQLPPWVPLAAGAVAIALFIWRQQTLQKADRALLDTRVFTVRTYRVGSILMWCVMTSLFSSIMILPLYGSRVLGLETLNIGLLLLPGGIFMGIAAPIVGRMVDKYGSIPVLMPGIAIVALALWLLSRVAPDTQIWYLYVAQLTMSIGLSMCFSPIFAAALGSLPTYRSAYGSAMMSTLQQVAAALGIAMFVTIYALVAAGEVSGGAVQAEAEAAGARAAYFVAACIMTVATFIVPFMKEKKRSNPVTTDTGAIVIPS